MGNLNALNLRRPRSFLSVQINQWPSRRTTAIRIEPSTRQAPAATVSPLMGNHPTSSPSPILKAVCRGGLKIKSRPPRHGKRRHTCSDNEVPKQKVPCSHAGPSHSSHCTVTHGETGYFGPARPETVINTWNGSFVNTGTLSSRWSVWSARVCVCVRLHVWVCLCAKAAAPRFLRNEALSRANTQHRVVSLCLKSPPITCACFQDTCVSLIDRTETVINRKRGRNWRWL